MESFQLTSNLLALLPSVLNEAASTLEGGSVVQSTGALEPATGFQILFDTRILLRITDYALWIAAGVIIGLIIRSVIRVAQGHSRPTRLSSAIILSAIFATAYIAIWHHYGWIPTLEPLLWATSHALTLAASLFWILRRWDREPPEQVESGHDTTLLLGSDDTQEIEQRRIELAARLNESLERDPSPRPLSPRLPRDDNRISVAESPSQTKAGQDSDLPWLDDKTPGRTRRRGRADSTGNKPLPKRRQQPQPIVQSHQPAVNQPRISVGRVVSDKTAKTPGGRAAQIPPRRTDRKQRSFIKPGAANEQATTGAAPGARTAVGKNQSATAARGDIKATQARGAKVKPATSTPRPVSQGRINGKGVAPALTPANDETPRTQKTAVRQIPSAPKPEQAPAARPTDQNATGQTKSTTNRATPGIDREVKNRTDTKAPVVKPAIQNDQDHAIGVLDSPPLNLSKKNAEIDDLETTPGRGAPEPQDAGQNNFLNPTRANTSATDGKNDGTSSTPTSSEAPGNSTTVNQAPSAIPANAPTPTKANQSVQTKQATQTNDPDAGDDSSNYFYELAWSELQSGKMHQALWAKAYSNADGEDAKARAWYIRYRVSQLETQKLKNERTQTTENRAPQSNVTAVTGQASLQTNQTNQTSQVNRVHQAKSQAYSEDNSETLNCKCCNHALMSTEIGATGIATVACNSCGQYSDVYTVNQEPILVKAHPHLTQSGSCVFCSDIGDTDAKLSDGSEYHESCYERLLLEFDELVEDHGSDRRATATYRAALHRVYDHWPDFPPDWAIRRQGKVIEKEHCHVCDGRNNLELIHKTSLQRGGSNLPNNLELICRACWEIRQANLSRATAQADRSLGA